MKKIFLLLLSGLVISVYAQDELKQATKAFKKMDYFLAVEMAQKATASADPKQQVEAWRLLGQTYQAIARDTAQKYKDYKDVIKLSWDAYEKAKEIDPEKKIEKKINFETLTFSQLASFYAYKFYKADDLNNAFICYEIACKSQKNPLLDGKIDTSIIYYTGVIAVSAKLYKESIPYLQQTIDMKYAGASPYLQLKNAYFELGDTAKGKEVLTKAIEAFSNDINVLVEVINFYINAGMTTEALNFLAKAKANDPQNITFHFVEGTLYEKINLKDSALQSYKNTIAIDSMYFNGYFNIGVMFYNEAKELYDQANKEKDDNIYLQLKTKADEIIVKSEPYLEKSYIMAKDEDKKVVGEALRAIYIRLNKMDKASNIKKEIEAIQ